MQSQIMLYCGIAVLTLTLLFCIIGKFWLYNIVMLSQLSYSIYLVILAIWFRSKLYGVVFVTMIILFSIMDRTYIFRLKARICQLIYKIQIKS